MKDPISVLYEDNHLLIVDKPAKYLVQGDETGDKPLLEYGKDYIKKKYDKPGAVFLGCVHRLDRPVSGVLMFARTSKALERLNKMFQAKKVHKVYWAVVKKRPKQKEGKLVHWLKKDPSKNKTTAFDQKVEGAKKAELLYKVMGKMNDHYLLEVRPLTGRPHQIRVQLASMGCPIRGDKKYGFPKANPDGSINLHAKDLIFEHPVKKEKMYIRAGVPKNQFWEQFLQYEELNLKAKYSNLRFD